MTWNRYILREMRRMEGQTRTQKEGKIRRKKKETRDSRRLDGDKRNYTKINSKTKDLIGQRDRKGRRRQQRPTQERETG